MRSVNVWTNTDEATADAAVRALAALLPEISKLEGSPTNAATEAEMPDWADPISGNMVNVPTPVVDLPLGTTEDRLVGALDIERALSRGEKAFEPGLLAKANRGYLYIDEVNLLDDHVVDVLLDSAAMGVNVVEREGLSIRHPARFVLVGSGNPEEGELRPQLLDRFGLSVEVTTPQDLKTRVAIVRQRDAFAASLSAASRPALSGFSKRSRTWELYSSVSMLPSARLSSTRQHILRRQVPQPMHLLRHDRQRPVDLLRGGVAPDAEPNRALGQLIAAPQGPQHVAGLAGGGGAGRSAGDGQLAEGEQETLPLHALETHVENTRDTRLRVAVEQHSAEAHQALPEPVPQHPDSLAFRVGLPGGDSKRLAHARNLVGGERP